MNRLYAFSGLMLPLFLGPDAVPVAYKLLPMPEVTLRVIDPTQPALMFSNATRGEAKTIGYWIALWNVDNPENASPLSIPDGSLRQLAPHASSPALRLFDTPKVRSSLKHGDRVVGSLGIHCLNCARGYSYRVYIAYGEGGWFAEIPDASDGAVLDRTGHGVRADILKDSLLAWVNKAEEDTRIAIATFEPSD